MATKVGEITEVHEQKGIYNYVIIVHFTLGHSRVFDEVTPEQREVYTLVYRVSHLGIEKFTMGETNPN
jgi:hypothetical protein